MNIDQFCQEVGQPRKTLDRIFKRFESQMPKRVSGHGQALLYTQAHVKFMRDVFTARDRGASYDLIEAGLAEKTPGAMAISTPPTPPTSPNALVPQPPAIQELAIVTIREAMIELKQENQLLKARLAKYEEAFGRAGAIIAKGARPLSPAKTKEIMAA